MGVNNIFTKYSSSVLLSTIYLYDCYYSTYASLQIYEIQIRFSRVADDIYFGLMTTKIKAKFDKYYLPILVIFGFGMLINSDMKEIGVNNFFEFLYSKPYNKIIRRKHNVYHYFRLLFE